MPPNSMGVSGPPPPGGMMMGPSNPYGPSGPPPPGLSTQHPLNMPQGMGMRPNPMYTSGGPTSIAHRPQGGGMPPQKHPGSRSNITTIQLQQLSAQMKAYKFLSRNLNPPEALMSIAYGRKPSPSMLATLSNKVSSGGGWGSSGSPGGGGAGGQSAPSPNPSPGPGLSSSGGGAGGGGGGGT